MEALNSRYPQLASPELLALAEDDFYPDRVSAIRSLGHHAHPGIEEKLNGLLTIPDKEVREAASEALRALRASASKPKRGGRHLNLFDKAKARLATWLQLDGLQQLVKEEQMAGVPENMVYHAVQVRIRSDAELARRYRNFFYILGMLFFTFVIFVLFTLVLAFHFLLWSAMGMLDEWPYFVGFLALAAVSFLPGISKFDDSRPVVLLQFLAFAVIAVALFGGIFYVWWVVTSGVAIAGLLILFISGRRRKRRSRDVRAALRLAHVAFSGAT